MRSKIGTNVSDSDEKASIRDWDYVSCNFLTLYDTTRKQQSSIFFCPVPLLSITFIGIVYNRQVYFKYDFLPTVVLFEKPGLSERWGKNIFLIDEIIKDIFYLLQKDNFQLKITRESIQGSWKLK